MRTGAHRFIVVATLCFGLVAGWVLSPAAQQVVNKAIAMPIPTSTADVTSVNDTNVSTTLLSASANRLAAAMYNDSTQVLYLKLGATASTTSFTVPIAAGGYYELAPAAGVVYTGVIDGIWAADAAGAVRLTELCDGACQ